MDILETIIAEKKKELLQRKQSCSIRQLEKSGFERWKINSSLVESLQSDGNSGVIAEFKRKSPSRGWFKPREFDIKDVVKAYTANGAAALSVLTDEQFFGGSLDDLGRAAATSKLPLLRKDFIVDNWQIAEAWANGADVILLIAACISKAEVKAMATYAHSIGLEVLLEIHNEEELDHICDEIDLVGVNNRNLKTFAIDINTSLQLVDSMPRDKPAIAESGISDVETIVTLRRAGFSGFLIGETFMKQPDPAIAFAEFMQQLKSKSS